MAIPKKISNKSASDYIKEKLEEKDFFSQALKKGLDIQQLAKERGIKLVRPV